MGRDRHSRYAIREANEALSRPVTGPIVGRGPWSTLDTIILAAAVAVVVISGLR